MELWVTATITAATFLISLFNAAIGPTGGLQLALVAGLLPPQISIPTHAVITGVSSLARAIQLKEYIDWALFWRFVPTSVAGTVIASFIFVQINEGILLARRNNLEFSEVSAIKNLNIEKSMQKLAQKIYDKHKLNVSALNKY